MTIRKNSVISAGLTNVLYTTGDNLGGLFTFSNVNDWDGGACIVRSAIITDKSAVLTACELWLFDFPVTTLGGDNNPLAISDAEQQLNLLGIMPFGATDIKLSTLNATGQYSGPPVYAIPSQLNATANLRNLYGGLIVRGAPAGFAAATDIQITLITESGAALRF